MGELTPEAAALMRSGRASFRPDASDRERVLQSLGLALGEGNGDGAPSAAPANVAARFSWGWGKLLGGLSVVGVGAGAIAAASLWTRAPAQFAARPQAPVAIPAETVAEAAPPPAETETEPASEPPRSGHATGAPRSHARAAARATSDSLAEEVRLLSHAEQQLSDGAGDGALETLAEHERRFPRGALTEQRIAARVEALCSVGRYPEARADLAKLAKAYPRSPHIDGARRFCGSGFASP
jgi:hypothetical protein